MTLPSGLTINRAVFDSETCGRLYDLANSQEWSDDIKRKTQQYGYKYDYEKRRILGTAPDMPDWLDEVRSIIAPYANCCIINHYYAGQGITAHKDNRCFGDIITTLSLGSTCMMNFIETKPISPRSVSVLLHQGDVVRMTGDVRYNWLHEIPSTKSDMDPETGKRIKRGERISLTFRHKKT